MADIEFQGLTAASTVVATDIVPVTTDLAGTPTDKKAAMSVLATYIESVIANLTAAVTITGPVTSVTPQDMLILYRPVDPSVSYSSGYKLILQQGTNLNTSFLTEQMRYDSSDDTTYQTTRTVASNTSGGIIHTFFGTSKFPYQQLETFDSVGTYTLGFVAGSTFSADRLFTVVTGDADRTLTLNASVALNQDLETTDDVQFAHMTLSGTNTTTSYETMQTWIRPTTGGVNFQSLFRFNLKSGAAANSTQIQALIGYGSSLTQEAYNIYSPSSGAVVTTFNGTVNTNYLGVDAGSVTTPSIYLINYPSTGFYENDTNSIGFTSNGVIKASLETDGFKFITPYRSITGTVSLTETNYGCRNIVNSASDIYITLPQNSTLATQVGSWAEIDNIGAGTITLVKEGSEIIRGATLIATGATAKVYRSSTSTWDVAGGTVANLRTISYDIWNPLSATYPILVMPSTGYLVNVFAQVDSGSGTFTTLINSTTVTSSTFGVSTSFGSVPLAAANTFGVNDLLSVNFSSSMSIGNFWVCYQYIDYTNLW